MQTWRFSYFLSFLSLSYGFLFFDDDTDGVLCETKN